MDRLGVVGMLGDDMPVDLLGLFQLGGAVVTQAEIEGLLERDLWHGENRWQFVPPRRRSIKCHSESTRPCAACKSAVRPCVRI